jgi:hypothetical protein
MSNRVTVKGKLFRFSYLLLNVLELESSSSHQIKQAVEDLEERHGGN